MAVCRSKTACDLFYNSPNQQACALRFCGSVLLWGCCYSRLCVVLHLSSQVGQQSRCCWAVCSSFLWREGHLPVCLLVKRQWVMGAAGPCGEESSPLAVLLVSSCWNPVQAPRSKWADIPELLLAELKLPVQMGWVPLLFWTRTILRFVSKCTICCRYVTTLVVSAQNLPLLSDTLFCRNSGLAHSLLKIENNHFLHINSFFEKVELEKLHLCSFQYDL